MAKKGVKFTKHTDKFKNQVVNDYFNNLGGSKNLAKKYNISYRTIDTWIYKFKRQGNLDNDIYKNRGRKKDENIDYKERYEILKKYQTFLKAQREKK